MNGKIVDALADADLATSSGVGLYSGSSGTVATGFSAGALSGGMTNSWFDSDGRVVRVAGPQYSGFNAIQTSTVYDGAGRVLSRTDGTGAVTKNVYDLAGNRRQQIDANQHATVYDYDGLGRVTSTQVSGKSSASTVDYSNGDLSTSTKATVTSTAPDGVVTTSTFDAAGHDVQDSFSDGSPVVTRSFNSFGLLTGSQVAGGAGRSVTYDTLGDVIDDIRDGQDVHYSYDLALPGRLVSIKYPNGKSVVEGYDSVGRWNQVSDWDGNSMTYQYDSDGGIGEVDTPGGVSDVRGHDANGAVSNITVTQGATTLAGWVYGRGTGGELASVTGTSGTSALSGSGTWGYDPAAQLVSSTGPALSNTFDAAGNPVKIGSVNQTFNAANELCWTAATPGTCGTAPSGSESFGYDDDGRRHTAGANIYGYDPAGNMTSASTGAASSTYRYTADGLRVSKTVGGTQRTFAWDSTNSVGELIRDGNDYYLYGPDGLPVERIGANPTMFIHEDGTGSVRFTTDTTGAISSTHNYTPWGATTDTTGTPPSLGWQHQYTDPETGFIYLRHRYYDPTTAQFLTPDPLYAITGERYGYAGNDPINESDPTGLCGFLGNGPCTPGGIAKEATNDTIKVATGGQANCVRYVTCSARTKSLASEHKTTTKLLYLTLGAAVTVASAGTLAPGMTAFGLSVETTSWVVAGAGIGSAFVDAPGCANGIRAACWGVALGGIAATGGAGAALFGGELGLGVGTFGTSSGIAAWFVDATNAFDPNAWDSSCP